MTKKTEKTTSRPADAADLAELSGRMYQGVEIWRGISERRWKSMKHLARELKTEGQRLEATIQAAEAGEPLEFVDGCFLVLKR